MTNLLLGVCVLSHFSHVQLFATLWTIAHPQGSSVRGVLQARILEWVAMPRSRDQTCISYVSCTGRGFFTTGTTWKLYTCS